MAGPPRCLAIRELLEGQPSLTFAFGPIEDSNMSKKYWQVAAGSEAFSRDYVHLFIRYGIAFVGQGCGIQKVEVGNIVLLKKGASEIITAGEVVERKGSHRGEGDKEWLEDIDGWDLTEYCYVDWRVPPAKPLKTKGLSQRAVTRAYKDEHINLANSLLSRPVQAFAAEPKPTLRITDEEILEFMISQGLRPSAADELTNTVRKIRLLAKYYNEAENFEWKDVREHETRTFLVVPLLLALGWAEQQMKIELPSSQGKIDIACFPRPYRCKNKECVLLIETKDFRSGLAYAPEQVRRYAAGFPACQVLVVTNGWCYKTFHRLKRTGSFDEKPSAYLNLLDPRDRYPLDPQHTKGACEVMKSLLPSSLR